LTAADNANFHELGSRIKSCEKRHLLAVSIRLCCKNNKAKITKRWQLPREDTHERRTIDHGGLNYKFY